MDVPDHVYKSLAKIQRNNLQLLIDHWSDISPMTWHVHFWFDEFCNQPPYDNVYTLFYHREVRHHLEGIIEAVAVFSQKFGQQYADLIRQAAEDHVNDDFGEIPSKAECSRHYLRTKRGW